MKILTGCHGIHISFTTLLKNVYIGYLFNPLLMGSTGGDMVRSYYLAKETGKKTEVVTVVFLDRFIGIVVMATLAMVALCFNLDDPRFETLFYSVIGLFCFLVLVGLVVSSQRVFRKVSFLGRFLGESKLKEIGKRIFYTLHHTKQYKKALLLTAFCTFLLQAMVIVSSWLASVALLEIDPISLKYFFLFLPVIFVISAIPISLGGFGVGEALYAGLFLIVGVSEANAITVSLLNRLIQVIMAILGAFVYLSPGTTHYEMEVVSNENCSKESGSDIQKPISHFSVP